MIGDSESDILAGKRYGIKTIAIGNIDTDANFVCRNLYQAARHIILLDGEMNKNGYYQNSF
jgi:phosphoglycolate phosphatase-like HAD superfamily hydrolase